MVNHKKKEKISKITAKFYVMSAANKFLLFFLAFSIFLNFYRYHFSQKYLKNKKMQLNKKNSGH